MAPYISHSLLVEDWNYLLVTLTILALELGVRPQVKPITFNLRLVRDLLVSTWYYAGLSMPNDSIAL